MEYSKYHVAPKSLGLVADWTYALNENGELSEVLDRLMRLVKADAAMIIRTSKADGKSQYFARCDMQTGKVWPTQPRAYAAEIVGEFFFSAKIGSIWKLSDTISRSSSEIPDVADGRPHDVVEGIVSPLESTRSHVDHIELHFKHRPAEHDLNLLIMLMGTFAVGWGRRAPGSISKKLNQKRNISLTSTKEGRQFSVLDVENPSRLSRCEYRVCALLTEGMTVNVIAKALAICPATVRSHLSSVYSKTGTTNQVELLHQLNSKPVYSGSKNSSERQMTGAIQKARSN